MSSLVGRGCSRWDVSACSIVTLVNECKKQTDKIQEAKKDLNETQTKLFNQIMALVCTKQWERVIVQAALNIGSPVMVIPLQSLGTLGDSLVKMPVKGIQPGTFMRYDTVSTFLKESPALICWNRIKEKYNVLPIVYQVTLTSVQDVQWCSEPCILHHPYMIEGLNVYKEIVPDIKWVERHMQPSSSIPGVSKEGLPYVQIKGLILTHLLLVSKDLKINPLQIVDVRSYLYSQYTATILASIKQQPTLTKDGSCKLNNVVPFSLDYLSCDSKECIVKVVSQPNQSLQLELLFGNTDTFRCISSQVPNTQTSGLYYFHV